MIKITNYFLYFHHDLMISLERNKTFLIKLNRFTIISKDILLILFKSSSALLTELGKIIPTISKVTNKYSLFSNHVFPYEISTKPLRWR